MDIPEASVTRITLDGGAELLFTDDGFVGFVQAPLDDGLNGAPGMAVLSPFSAANAAVVLMDTFYPELADICRKVLPTLRQIHEAGLTVRNVGVEAVPFGSEPGAGGYI